MTSAAWSQCKFTERAISFVIDLHSNRLSPARLRARAGGDEQVHFSAKIDMRLFLRANHRVVHDTGVGIDAHALKNIERTRNVVGRDVPRLNGTAEILPAAMIRNLFRVFRVNVHSLSKDAL